MDEYQKICVIFVADSLGLPKRGEDGYPTVHTLKNQHGSDLLMDLLRNYAEKNGVVFKFANEKSYDDHWLFEFLSRTPKINSLFRAQKIATVALNLREFSAEGTEWVLWTHETSEFTDGIRAFLEAEGGLKVRT